MTANALAKAISARIEAAWEKMPDKEAPLTVAQVRELELDISDILRQAKSEVCTHPHVDRDHADEKPYCWDCCSLVESKSEAKAGG